MNRYYVQDEITREDGSIVRRIWDGKQFLRGEGKCYRRQAEARKAAARAINRGMAYGTVTIQEYSVGMT